MEHLHVVHPETGRPTGEILTRAELHARGEWCRGTNIFILNSKGQVLCHQREYSKEFYPGAWMTHVGGHVAKDETYESTAAIEIFEETGVRVDEENLIHWRTTRHEGSKLWLRDFVVILDKEITEFTPQAGEVIQFAWKNVEEVVEGEKNEPNLWKAGTHDFWTEYHSMRAVITALTAKGLLERTHKMHYWAPGVALSS